MRERGVWRRFLFALALVSAVSSGCGGRLVPGEVGEEVEVAVVRIVDGDTIEVSPAIKGVEDVRLIGVDAPEKFAPDGPQPYAWEATEFAEDNLGGRRVTLEFDIETKDDYGRLLAYVHVGGSMFNEELLGGGYARVATFPPNTRYVDRFRAAQREAREARRGMWGLPASELCRLPDLGNGVGCRGEALPAPAPSRGTG